MPIGHPLTMENRKNMIVRYIHGEKPQEIADNMGFSYTAVLKTVTNSKSLDSSPKKRGRKKGFCPVIDDEKVKALFTKQPEIYIKEASVMLGYAASSVQLSLKRLGMTRKKSKHFTSKVVLKNN
jgi:hypothetical protein